MNVDAPPLPTLADDHLADLRRSGLTDETIARAEIAAIPLADLRRYVSPRIAEQITSAYVIPYPGAEPFYRTKLFPPVANGDGRPIRYYQPTGTAPRLYIPTSTRAVLADPTVELGWQEGEKKTLAAAQAGVPSVGLGGLWSWLHDGEPIADLGLVDHVGRTEILIPDSDVWTRPDLLRPVYALGKELEARGASVLVKKLPAGPDGAKVGLDDYLCAHDAAELERLPRFPLKHAAFGRTAEWWKAWRKRREDPGPGSTSALEVLERGETVRMLHPAQDVVDGVLWYGVATGSTLVLLTSTRTVLLPAELPGGLQLRHAELPASSVTRDLALEWVGGAAPGSVARALDALADFFRRYVVFRDARTPLLVAAWSLGSWCYRAFRIFPYLSLRSAEKRCGKTRLLGVIGRVGFNASPICAVPTEAQLYRGAARTGGVQLFDEAETLRGDKDRFEALIAVLNVGFERGGVVSRLEKRGERFVDVAYEVYAPRALAGISGLKDTLEDRSLPIFMLRRRRDEPVARLTAAVDTDAQALRDACARACLTRIGDILTAYGHASALLEREGIDDRAVDLWSPLTALTVVADAEEGGDRTAQLLGVARDLAGIRDADAETGQTYRLVEALSEIQRDRGEKLTPGDLLAALQTRPGFEWARSTRRLSQLLHPLGLVRRQVREGNRQRWCYELDADVLADLRARYGGAELSPDGHA